MSDDEERAAKRQRRSYSPASPPALNETKKFVHQPQTPPPSVNMSPNSWTAPANTSQQGGSGATFPSPPSTAGFQSQQIGIGSEEGVETGAATPAGESEVGKVADGDANMTDVGAVTVREQRMEEDAEHRRTDHERQVGEERAEGADVVPDLPPAPRLYTSSSRPIAPSRPHPSQNVIELYNLTAIQASVARKDAAGNKINKLRKSYEGKLKTLGLEGRNRATASNRPLFGLMETGWDFDVGGGQTMWDATIAERGFSADGKGMDELLGKLDSAFGGMKPGHLPKAEHAKWVDVLGLDAASNANKPLPAPAASNSANKPNSFLNPALAKTAPAQAIRSAPGTPPLSGPPGAVRPERQGKKRRYDESSYSGYQEGYEDDGYSTGDLGDGGSRRGSASKRQKTVDGGSAKRKDFPTASSPPFNTNSSGGMVGVRSS